jgi:hypothetical protein
MEQNDKEIDVYLPKIDSPRTVIRYICALLNTHREGHIFLGFDKNTKLLGVEEGVLYSIQKDLDSIIPNPSNLVTINIDEAFIVQDGKRGCLIKVKEGTSLYRIEDSVSKYYVYVKNKIKFYTDISEAQRMSEYISSGLPYILSYEPSDAAKRLEQKKWQLNNRVEIASIGELPKGNYFYKYIDLEALLLSLKNNTLRFVEPTFWPDKYEGRFYNANYKGINVKSSDTPFLYACCFTLSKESEAAWKVYSYQKKGLGAHCVELRIKRNRLREQLIKNTKDCQLYIGKVVYKKSTELNELHASNIIKDGISIPAKDFDKYFRQFNLYKYLNLILLKRDAFAHENEVRYLIIPNDAESRIKSHYEKKPDGDDELQKESEPYDIKNIDWLDIIDSIQIDKNCSVMEREILSDRINILINARKDLTDAEKSELKKRLEPTPFDVYGVAEEINIGEAIRKTSSSV